MLKPLAIAITATAMLSTSASARLWETKAELDKRYGKPANYEKNEDGDNFAYVFGEFEVIVTLLGGKSQSELYSRRDGQSLMPDQISMILSLNALGNDWRLNEEGVYCLVKPAGGRPIALAIYELFSGPPVLGVCTPDFVKKKSGQVFGKSMSP
jgi:hypothetical protein